MNHLINFFKINGKFIQIGIWPFCLVKILNFSKFERYINCRVYCDYFHSSERKFENPENKLIHFLEKIFSPDWEWREQYPDSKFENISMDEFDKRKYYLLHS